MVKGAKKDSQHHHQPVNIGILEACLIGLVAAFGAVILKHGVGLVGSIRVSLSHDHTWLLPVIGLTGGVVAGLLLQYVVPEASGSGIPQTKATLYGIQMPLGIRLALVKLVGCIASLGSGMALGREGPTVHVAAALSSKVSLWIRTSPTHRIQLIAAGAGAGLAAAFNAPLAGVLFVLEELLQKMSGLAVGTTVVACFVASVTSRLVGVHSLDVNFSELAPKATFTAYDIPFVILLGIAAGIIGSLFNKCIIQSLTFTRDVVKKPFYITCGLAGLLTGLILMVCPFMQNYALLRQTLVEGELGIGVVSQALLAQFVLTVISYGSGAPGGLFAPSLTMGACLGHFLAITQNYFFQSGGDCGTFAVVGMGAVFCAVARVPITAVVIIFEMTQDFNVVLPLMISCIIAYLVAERLDPGSLYDQLLHWSGIDLKESEGEDSLITRLPARKFMQKNIESIKQTATLQEVRQLFENSRHQGFPVVDDEMRPVGIITKPDIIESNRKKLPDDTSIEKVMTPKPITVRPDEYLSGVLHLIEKFGVSRIPVVERGKLVGIITRSDIVSAESKLIGLRTTASSSSYVVYQTRSAEAGQGRMVVAVGDPETAENLLGIAADIAKIKNFELECVHIITVPRDRDPAESKVSDSIGRKIAAKAEALGAKHEIPVHTSIRVAHDVGAAMAESITERDADLFLMRYSSRGGAKKSQNADNIVQTILKNTNCPVILLNQAASQAITGVQNVVVPVGNYLEHELPVRLARVFVAGSGSEGVSVHLLNVHEREQERAQAKDESTTFDTTYTKLKKKLDFDIHRMATDANSPTKLLSAMKDNDHCDLMIMGMPRKSLLKSMYKGAFKRSLEKIEGYTLIITASKYEQVYKRKTNA